MIDAFLYAGEIDLLELRVRTLERDVRYFVPTLCSLTHQSERSAHVRHVEEVEKLAARLGLADRIRPYVVAAHRLPVGERGGAGTRYYQRIERAHRSGIRLAVDQIAGLAPDEIVLVSDVDEIPNPAYIGRDDLRTYFDAGSRWLVLLQRFHSTYLDWLHPAPWWQGTTISLLRDLQPQAMRDARVEDGVLTRIGGEGDWAGWHLSWLGDDVERRRKLETFSHAELARGGFDPRDARADVVHSNGEPLHRMTMAEIRRGPWPAPLLEDGLTGSFPAWWMSYGDFREHWRPPE